MNTGADIMLGQRLTLGRPHTISNLVHPLRKHQLCIQMQHRNAPSRGEGQALPDGAGRSTFWQRLL